MIIRAHKERVTKLDHDRLYKSQDDDRKGAFITDAALHLVNTESVKDLQMILMNKYRHSEELLR